VGLDLTKLERMTAEDVDTEVQRYLGRPAPTPTDLQVRAETVTALRLGNLWPRLYRPAGKG
jgi:hypothetical protein